MFIGVFSQPKQNFTRYHRVTSNFVRPYMRVL